MRTLVLGLGNPILGDDGVGLLAARSLYEGIRGEDTDLVEAAASGLQTVQLMSGYDRAVIIDSVHDQARAGQVRRVGADELETCPLLSSHGVGLGQAIHLARRLGMRLPDSLLIYAIAVSDPYTLREGLTPELERALPSLVRQIASDLASIWQ